MIALAGKELDAVTSKAIEKRASKMSDKNGKSYWFHEVGNQQINVFTQHGVCGIALYEKGKTLPKACVAFDDHKCRFQFGESSVDLELSAVFATLFEMLDRAGDIAEGNE